MDTQTSRRTNLLALIELLERDGLCSREAQAQFLGDVVTPKRLQLMLDGSHIDAMFAEHVEHVFFKPKGWMSGLRKRVTSQAD